MKVRFYKDGDYYYIKDEIIPQGTCTALFNSTGTELEIRVVSNRKTVVSMQPVTDYQTQASVDYADKTAILGAVGDFFVRASGGGGSLIDGTVDVFANLPSAAVNNGKVYFVTDNSGGWLSWLGFYKYPKGLYVSNGTIWEPMPLSVKFSEDSLTLLNITNWAEYFNVSADINVGDKIIYNGVTYTNLTGTQISTAPDADVTNWGSYIDLDTNKTTAYKEGRIFYDSKKKALSYYNEISDITINLAQEFVIRVKNTTGNTITNGQILTSLSSDGAVHTVQLANAKEKYKSRFIGVATADILNTEIGYATMLGDIGNINTSSYTAGQPLWLSAVTGGAWSVVPPDDGAYDVLVGVVKIVHATDGVITVFPNISNLTVEVTDTNGFPEDQKTGTTISKVDLTRTFTIAPTGPDFHFYELGNKYEKTSSESIVWTDIEGEHWFFYDTGILSVITNPTGSQKSHLILNHSLIGFLYWNSVAKKCEVDLFEERHGIGMSPVTHLYLHLTQGAKYHSGLAVGDVISDGNGSLDTHVQFSVTAGTFFDEDITLTPSAFAVGDTMQVVYNFGSGVFMRTGTQTNFSVLNAPSGRLYYNQNNVGTWQLTEVPNSDFVLYHVFAVNGVNVGLISIMGQNFYPNLGTARAGASSEISDLLGQLPFAEMIPLATIIYQTRDTYSNTVKARIRSTDTGEDFIDWRVSELSQGTPASNHLNLTNLQLAGTGVTWGHIDDQPQGIFGIKTFNEFPITPNTKPTADYQVVNKKYIDDLNFPSALTNNLGNWNASTNTPTVISATGTAGDWYTVSVAGTTTIDGINSWAVGDYIWFDGDTSTWQKIDNQAAQTTTPATPTGAIQFNNFGNFGGDVDLFWDNSNKRLGIGTNKPIVPLHIVRTVTDTNVVKAPIVFNTITTGDMADGFGSGFTFRLEDDTSGSKSAGFIGTVRDGSDNEFSLIFYTNSGLGVTERMRLKPLGDLEITGSVSAANLNYSTTEIDTKTTWINGKTIYRKAYTGTTGSGASSNVDTSATLSLENIISTNVIINNSGGDEVSTQSNNYGTLFTGLNENSGNIEIFHNSAALQSRPYNAWIEYTKV